MTLIPINRYTVRRINQKVKKRKEVNMGILTILGDFLVGVGVVLLGVAAIYYVMLSKEV